MELSVITITYNGLEDTLELLESLSVALSKIQSEIIVVDNGSRINEALEIENRYPQVITLRSELNLGFAGGNNLGIKQAKGKYLLFINNDTIVYDNLYSLVERMENNKTLGALSPKIRFAFDDKRIQFAGYSKLSTITLRNKLIGYEEIDKGQYDKFCKTSYVHGAAMIIPRSVIESVGEMPELYFLYYEELDWSVMISNAGYELAYDPTCTVYHKESRATGRGSALREYYLTRNRLIFALRNTKGFICVLSILYQIFVVGIYKFFKDIISLKSEYAYMRIKAILHFVMGVNGPLKIN